MDKTRRFFLTGASFSNKGAEAMIFVMVSELREKYPGCEIYIPNVALDDERYRFTGIYVDERSHEYMKGGIHRCRALGEMLVRKLLKHKGHVSDVKKLAQMFDRIDAVFDISGYNLSNRWDYAINRSYLRYIEEAKKSGVPVYLMPQSFGPFDYEGEMAVFDRKIREFLPYPRMIFCREEDGFRKLSEKYGLQNLHRSADIVLQSNEISVHAVMSAVPETTMPDPKPGSVGIIPNFMNLKYCNRDNMIAMYKRIIESVLKLGRDVYIMHHSKGDVELCRDIYASCQDERLHLLEEDFRCYEFSELVTKFDFLIASRFHALVHAFREGVPCIAIGWSIKYQNLLHSVGQDQFLFDIRSVDEEKLKHAIKDLSEHRSAASVLISSHVQLIQERSCFDSIFEDLDSIL